MRTWPFLWDGKNKTKQISSREMKAVIIFVLWDSKWLWSVLNLWKAMCIRHEKEGTSLVSGFWWPCSISASLYWELWRWRSGVAVLPSFSWGAHLIQSQGSIWYTGLRTLRRPRLRRLLSFWRLLLLEKTSYRHREDLHPVWGPQRVQHWGRRIRGCREKASSEDTEEEMGRMPWRGKG